MSFTWHASNPLLTREQWMRTFIEVADELDMPDRRGACICAAMCAFQEAGADPHKTGQRQIWIPGNNNDPAFRADPNRFRHDSLGNDGASTGPFQQQAGANWGWGGNLGDPEGTRKRMDPRESTRMFMGHPASGLKRKGYNASNAQSAGDSIQRVQGSSFPRAYDKWWDEANRLYDAVKGSPPPPAPQSYGMPRGSNSGGYGGNGVRFPEWVYALGNVFGLKPSTYPGHQENHRDEAGYAPNPQGHNRGIDWAAPGAPDEIDRMTRFADYLATIPQHLEQVIWQNPRTMRSIEVAGGRHQPGYFRSDLPRHRNHVHTRQSKPIPLPGGTPPPPIRPAVTAQRHGDPTWLLDVLRAEGLTVNEVPGWRERGHGDFGEIRGIMAHHTGSNNASPESIAFHPSLGLASQLHLARNGVWTVCGAGIAWHAGNGGGIPWLPNNDANRYTIGIEAANDGGGAPGKPHRSSWPAAQYDSYVRGCAAILRKLGWGADRVIGHKEWAGKSQGKWDPGAIDMNTFRADIQARLSTHTPTPQGDDDLTPEQDQMLRAIFREQTQRHPSRSALRKPGEGPVDTWAGMGLNTDGNVHLLASFLRAWLGHPKTLDELRVVAGNSDRPDDADLAQAILAEVADKPRPTPIVATTSGGVDTSAVVEAVRSAVAESEPKIIYTAAPEPVRQFDPPPPVDYSTAGGGTTGQRIGQLVDAVEQMRLSEKLSPQEAATLKAVISILEPQTKEGDTPE